MWINNTFSIEIVYLIANSLVIQEFMKLGFRICKPYDLWQRCCYRTDGSFSLETRKPQAGSLQRYNAFNSLIHNSKDHQIKDIEPKNWCCYPSNLCELYYALRPTVQCIASSWSRAFLFGDPHIITFDERYYIFNGLGEFTILELDGFAKERAVIHFIMQGRTCSAFNSNGMKARAAVWCGFAFKSGKDNTLTVEISTSGKIMVIYANKRDYSAQFQSETEFFAMENGMVIRKQNDALKISFCESIGATITLIYGFLEVSVSLEKKYQSMTRGLLGNFNYIKTDDFIFRNGTRLSDESSERDIFHFVQSWAIAPSDNLFQYGYGQNTSTFSHPNIIPLFYDDLNKTITNSFNTLCNGTFKIPCIYDYIATLNETLAKHSTTVADQFIMETIKMANEAPVINLNQTYFEVYIHKPFYLNANGFDLDGNIVHFIVLTDVSCTEIYREQGTATHITSTFKCIVSDAIPITIGITAVDDKNLQSEIIPLTLTLCTGCSNQGSCNFSSTRPTTSPYFSYATCNCNPGHTGTDCEEAIDSCAANPCPLGCVNLRSNLEKETGTFFNCVNCPVGFNLNIAKTKCEDFNECEKSPCDSLANCENTYGSFICNCVDGYRNVNNICVDINECAEHFENCDQICVNTPGKFKCSCLPGFKSSNNTCVKIETDPNLCKSVNKTCEYGCNDTQGCFCKHGFNLTEDGIHCKDIDECKKNICSQNCSNSDGSFMCSCYSGFRINSKDAHICESCPDNMYGLNCASQCECKGHALRCDSIKGCICQDNWKGTNCGIDVDECIETPNICPADHYCTNTQGSYTCDCPTGFEKINGTCINLNECTNVLINNCSQRCIDVPGSFICECIRGFTKFSNGTCKDIDECKNGQSGCEQICLNVPGSSYCECYPGYRLKDDRKTCEKDAVDPCIQFPLSCSQGCTVINGIAQCFCHIGFTLSPNNFECIDINECKPENKKCDWRCVNTLGSYNCSCPIGYKLKNDKLSCEACDAYHWGVNCATTCNCSIQGTSNCDAEIGCQCKKGWAGTWCEIDQDECSSEIFPCLPLSSCVNRPGSFECQCKEGYVNMDNQTCTDVDECLERSSLCDLMTTTCKNTYGSYACICKTGHLTNINDKYACKVNYVSFPLTVKLKYPSEKKNTNVYTPSIIEFTTLAREIADSLSKFGKEKLGQAILPFVVNELKNGPIIAYTELQVDQLYSNSYSDPASTFAYELYKAGNLTIGSEVIQVLDVSVCNTSLEKLQSSCEVYSVLKNCSTSPAYKDNTVAACDVTGANSALIIGLSVGLSLIVIITIAILVCVIMHYRKSRQKHNNEHEIEINPPLISPSTHDAENITTEDTNEYNELEMHDIDPDKDYQEISTTSEEHGANIPDFNPYYEIVKDTESKKATIVEVASSPKNKINPDIPLRVKKSSNKPVNDSEVKNSSYNEISPNQNSGLSNNLDVTSTRYNEINQDNEGAYNLEEANTLYSEIVIYSDDDTVYNPYNQLAESGNNNLDMEHVYEKIHK